MTDVRARPVVVPLGRRRRAPVRRFLVVMHRWVSLVVGVVLLAITTSGAVLLYAPEIRHALDHGAYDVPDSGLAQPSGADERAAALVRALDAVRAAHPDAALGGAYDRGDVDAVVSDDFATAWTVDPATGTVLGQTQPQPAWLSLLENVHECFLTCEDRTGYVPVLHAQIPHTTWLTGYDEGISVGSLLLGLLGVALVFLCVSGVWLWFPRPRRWRQAVTVRTGRGRFARDTDLHKVIGVLALAPLLVWGVTGAGYEIHQVEQAWYALLPGSELEGPVAGLAAAARTTAEPLTAAEAVERARATAPGGEEVTGVVLPSDGATTYTVWLSTPHDPYRRTDYPGDVGVSVDEHTGATETTYGFTGEPVAQTVWQAWNYPVHSGFVVTGWWRAVWALFGLTPLALAVTGTSTWLVRRATARRRRAAQVARGAV